MAAWRDTLKNFWRSRIKRSPPPAKARPEAELPLGLSRDQLESLLGLTAMPAFKHYSAALERLYETNLAALLRGLPHDGYLFQCGVCTAIEQIARLPADLSEKVKALDARPHAQPDADLGALVFANSPFWDAYRRRAGGHGGPGIPLPGQ